MLNSTKKRFLCALLAGTVLFSGIAFPATARADEDDDHDVDVVETVEDLEDVKKEEKEVIDVVRDFDHDGDIDEKDVEVVSTIMTIAFLDGICDAAEADAEKQAAAEAQAAAVKAAATAAANTAANAVNNSQKKEEKKDVKVTGIDVSSTGVELTPGQSFQISAAVRPGDAKNRGVSYSSNDSSVASVDGNGMIWANKPGNCIITARSNDGGFQAYTYVRVNPSASTVAQTMAADAAWLTAATNMVMTAAPHSVVNLVATKPMTFDKAFANALKTRSDVGVIVTFPYNGLTHTMAIPAGYNLTSKLANDGSVSFLKLSTVNDGKLIVSVKK
ncbi:MAG: Ig-like domain-containing protein [Lachnospiraceae bacterium]|nr:Ig-like domain-containing protein [Lachnospiraceae bacterium]